MFEKFIEWLNSPVITKSYQRGGETAEVLENRWSKKKNSLETIANNVHRLRLSASKDIRLDNEDEKEFLTALVVLVMLKTGERVGNSLSASQGHYGITGLLKKHIKIVDNTVNIAYAGKSGVSQDKSFTDERIAKALRLAIKRSPSKSVFETSDGFRVRKDRVNRYLSDFNVTSKALRSYSANKWMTEKLANIEPSDTEKGRKKQLSTIAKSIAERVGHSKNMLLKSYMTPEIQEKFIETGEVVNIKELSSGGVL